MRRIRRDAVEFRRDIGGGGQDHRVEPGGRSRPVGAEPVELAPARHELGRGDPRAGFEPLPHPVVHHPRIGRDDRVLKLLAEAGFSQKCDRQNRGQRLAVIFGRLFLEVVEAAEIAEIARAAEELEFLAELVLLLRRLLPCRSVSWR